MSDKLHKADHLEEGSPNRDPITGEAGAHPVGVGLGAAGAGAAGAAIGAAAGPVGAIVGAVVGSVVGGLAGKGVAEAVDPTEEDAYWRDNYHARPYVTEGESYDTYAPAYRHGWESKSKYPDASFDAVEHDIARDWTQSAPKSSLTWEKARAASKDAWQRVEDTVPGDHGGKMR